MTLPRVLKTGEAITMKKAASKWHVLIAVLITVLMGPIDASAVNVAFPSMSEYFKVSVDMVGWVSMSYLLVLSSFQLSFGRLGDMFGFRRIFLAGINVFTIASILCGISWNIGALIVFRTIQAIGAGMTSSLAASIITATFPPQERGKALGMLGTVVALGLATGPSLGGLLLDLWGWKTIFFINIPIGIIAFLVCYKLLPEKEELTEQKFHWAGACLALICLASLLFFISRGQYYQWSGLILPIGFLALITGALFIIQERKTTEPMLELGLFRSHAFTAGNIAALFHFMTQYIIVFVTPFYLQQQLGFASAKVGIIMTAFPLTVLLIAPLSGALSDKIGNRLLTSAGAIFCALGALSLSFMGPDFLPSDIVWRLSLFGLGTGMFQSPNNSAIMGAVPKIRLGIAGSVLATTRNVGMVIGIAIGSAVLTVRQASYLFSDTPFPHLLAMQDAYIMAAFLSALCFAACLLVKAQMANRSG
jgi:EmrB/QacA subfamily drug resistance transporter